MKSQVIQETPTSLLVFGEHNRRPVVLKVIRRRCDEWRCGEVLRAFDGKGVVRVLEHSDGVVLMERLTPGTSLASLSLNGRDEEATEILANVACEMAHPAVLESAPTVEQWGLGFQRHLDGGDRQIPRRLVETAAETYARLCATQQTSRLLHGDLQHYNVLFDRERGWVAIDPKGVVGEVEYELGASLRNPIELPNVFLDAQRIERRVEIFHKLLKVNSNRVLAWAFAQAVLSAIWSIEDGSSVGPEDPMIILATLIGGELRGDFAELF